MTQKVHVEVNYGYDRVYPDDVNLSAVVDDITYMEHTYGHASAQVNVSLVEPEPDEPALPTAVGSVVKEAYSDGSSLVFVLERPGRWVFSQPLDQYFGTPGDEGRVEVLYDAGKERD